MYAQGFLKVAAASPNARAGDAMYNVRKIIEVLNEAKTVNPGIICFPELCITGYSAGDLFFHKYLYDDALKAIQYLLDNNPFKGVIIFGSYVYINDTIFNCSFIIQNNKILGVVPKNYLPHTNEFHEARWFQSSSAVLDTITSINLFGYDIPFGKIIFVDESGEIQFSAEICADMWAPISPNEVLYSAGALIVFNSSASPSYIGKGIRREVLTRSISLKFNGAYVYVSNNASESTSEVVFSSHKLIVENGKVLSEDKKISLESSIIYGDIDILKLHHLRCNNSYYKNVQSTTNNTLIRKILVEIASCDNYIFSNKLDTLPFVPKMDEDYQKIIDIQAVSVIKRLQYIGIEKCVLGVSGGLDSTLALLSLCYAFDSYQLPRKNIIAITMPSIETSSKSLELSRALCKNLDVTFKEIPINEDVKRQLSLIGHSVNKKDITYENAQARLRTLLLMNTANLEQAIVIGTTDMSEIALGWSTFGGDHMAMYGLNSGLTKTVVIKTVEYYKNVFPKIDQLLDEVLDAPISPELTGANQLTEETLGKYEINDFILYRFLVTGDTPERIIYLLEKFFNLSLKQAKQYLVRFKKRFFSQQYKRLSAPEGVKILEISLSPRSELLLKGDIYSNES